MARLTRDDDLARVLASSPTIAVLGAHDDLSRAAGYVPAYLHRVGHRILPVNPTRLGHRAWGEPFVASLADLPARPELVDVFRRSDALAGHLPELLALRPPVVWFQLGVRDDAVTAALLDAGIDVVVDRCTMAEHRRLRVGAPGAPR
jgi:predicted CoA-binding protein